LQPLPNYSIDEKLYIWYQMIKLKFPWLKSIPANCLLAGLLFFSFITIAGYNGSSNPLLRQKPQTELAYSNFSKTTHQSVSYKILLPSINRPINFSSYKYGLITLLVHNRLTKVKFDDNSKKSYSISIPHRYFPIKMITQSPDGDSFTSTEG
jgi:hypothetical protein